MIILGQMQKKMDLKIFLMVTVCVHKSVEQTLTFTNNVKEGQPVTLSCETTDFSKSISFDKNSISQGGCTRFGFCQTTVDGYSTPVQQGTTTTTMTINSYNKTRDEGTWTCSFGTSISLGLLLTIALVVLIKAFLAWPYAAFYAVPIAMANGILAIMKYKKTGFYDEEANKMKYAVCLVAMVFVISYVISSIMWYAGGASKVTEKCDNVCIGFILFLLIPILATGLQVGIVYCCWKSQLELTSNEGPSDVGQTLEQTNNTVIPNELYHGQRHQQPILDAINHSDIRDETTGQT